MTLRAVGLHCNGGWLASATSQWQSHSGFGQMTKFASDGATWKA